MSDTVLHLVEHFGYAVIGVLILAEGLGLPFPGEAALLVGAAIAGTTGRLTLAGVILTATAAAIAGAAGGYWIGASVSDERLHRWADRVGIGAHRFQRAQEVFRAHGVRSAILGRFVAVLRMVVALLAGASRMPFGEFLLYSSIGAVAWATVFGVLGYAFGSRLPWLEAMIGRTTLAVLLGVVLAATVLWLWRRRRREEAGEA